MEISIRPLVAPGSAPGTLRVWAGIFDYDAAPPDLSWTVDDRPAAVEPVRPLRRAASSAPDLAVASGVFDLVDFGSTPGTVRARAGAVASPGVRMRPVPVAVPPGPSQSLTVLLTSCFYQRNDKAGRASPVVAGLTPPPDLTLCVGDQVYLDQPPLNFEVEEARLASVFAQQYRTNFVASGSLATILRAAPVAAIPDDHEYWNNYPHRSAMTLQSLPDPPNAWSRAARAMYDAFQLGRSDEYSYAVDVEPVSIFLMDNRTFRTRDGERTMREEDKQAYTAWMDRVIADGLAPVLATGPSLFQPPKHGWARLTDRNMANYGDYPFVMAGLLRLAQSGRDVLALTGDVHYPRLVELRAGGATIREVIASPTSLVWGSRPAPAAKVSGRYTDARLNGVNVWPTDDAVRGDNVAVLRFTRADDHQLRLDLQFLMIRQGTSLPLAQLRLRH